MRSNNQKNQIDKRIQISLMSFGAFFFLLIILQYFNVMSGDYNASAPIPKSDWDKEFDNGSGITFPNLDKELLENLALLGKVWGLLKYYHPNLQTGEYNWDYELLRFLPEYLDVKKNNARDQLIIDWISQFGELPVDENSKEVNLNVFLRPDHKWIENKDFSNELRGILLNITNDVNSDKHFYVKLKNNIGNPEFLNENAYKDMTFPDAGFRLLGLYRYWNMIHYFFPYRYLIDKDWNNIIKEYLPKYLNASDELAYEIANLQLIEEVDDTHANLYEGGNKIEELRGNFYPPMHLRFIEGKLVITDFYNPEIEECKKFEIGDIITQINGKSIPEIVDSLNSFYPASNQPTRLRNMAKDMLRSPEQEIDIRYLSGNKVMITKLKLFDKDNLNIYDRWYPDKEGRSFEIIDDNIGYVTLQNISQGDINIIKKEMKNTQGIIIDIRNYPSKFVPFSLGPYFVSTKTPFVKFTAGSIENPGEFGFTPNLEIPATSSNYKNKLVVLVNEFTQSMAEYTTMAFQAGQNTTVLGSTTAGADGNISTIFLPGGIKTIISGIGVYYPDGAETQRVGIVPDIEVLPTISGIRQGDDEQLEAAIDFINESK